MALPTRPSARRRALAIIAAGATAASGAALLGAGTSQASSHRESPYTQGDPAIDTTDVYAFTSPDDATTATLIASFFPDQSPAGGPNFYPYATDARYNFNVDNNGDALADVIYRYTFKDIDKRGTTKHGDEVGGSFLYNDGPVDSLDDPNLLFRQTYDLQVVTNASAGNAATATVVTDVPVVPANVGKASVPDYTKLRAAGVRALPGGGKSYAGQADDSFFIDLRVFDLLYGGNFSEIGDDSLNEKNVNTLVLQVPKTQLAGGGNVTDNPVIGVWSTTERLKNRVYKSTNAAPATSGTRSSDTYDASGEYVQVSRLGAPLVNEVVVPANLKDYFNRSTPDKDAQFLKKVTDPELPYLVELIYGIPNPNKVAAGKDRPDLVQAFLTGVPTLNATSINKNNPAAGPAPSEMLRLNLSTPVATDKYSRLGAVGGDVAGFPNGRRLGDDVVDIALQVVEGVLLPGAPAAVKGLGDGVNSNTDRPYLSTFPYMADPNSGSDPDKGQQPVSFVQNFTSQNGVVTASATRITPAAKGGFAQLYRINADGSATGLGSSPISADGTATVTKTFRVKPGTVITLNWRVFPARGSAAGENRGVATTMTVR